MDGILELRSELLFGFFHSSNAPAFLISADLCSGVLTDPKPQWIQAVHEAMSDLRIIADLGKKKANHLADFGVTLNEILDDIARYDDLPNDASS